MATHLVLEPCPNFHHVAELATVNGEPLELRLATLQTAADLRQRLPHWFDTAGPLGQKQEHRDRYHFDMHLPLQNCDKKLTDLDLAAAKSPMARNVDYRTGRVTCYYHVNANSDHKAAAGALKGMKSAPASQSGSKPPTNAPAKTSVQLLPSDPDEDSPETPVPPQQPKPVLSKPIKQPVHHIRVGTSDWYRDNGKKGTWLVNPVVVGKVHLVERTIKYLEVPTWEFGGRQIGNVDLSSDDFTVDDLEQLDADFHNAGTTRQNLDSRLLVIAHALEDGCTRTPFALPRLNSTPQVVFIEPLALPEQPDHSPGLPDLPPYVEAKDTIDVVVTVRNELGNDDAMTLNPKLNVQVSLESHEDCRHFVK